MNAKGYKTSWNGFKLHLDITDVGLPISALVTSASLHDSQVAIPLMKLTSGKVTYFYDLMDAAYDADGSLRQVGSSIMFRSLTKMDVAKKLSQWPRTKQNAIKDVQLQNGLTVDQGRLWSQQCHGSWCNKSNDASYVRRYHFVCRSTYSAARLACQRPKTQQTQETCTHVTIKL